MAVFLEEIFETRRHSDRLGVFFKNPLEQARLDRHHALVVNLRQRIQFCARFFELLCKICGHRVTKVIETQINRVQGIHADRRIRIRVGPIMRRGGIVDRQNLNELESRLRGPISQRFEVGKFTDTKTVFTAQGKNRNRNPRPTIEACPIAAITFVAYGRPLILRQRPRLERTVFADLQGNDPSRLHITKPVLVLDAPIARQIELRLPAIRRDFRHRHRFRPVPIANLTHSAQNARHHALRHGRHPQRKSMIRSLRHECFSKGSALGQNRIKTFGLKRVIHRARRTPGVAAQHKIMLGKVKFQHPRPIPFIKLNPISLLPQLVSILHPQRTGALQIDADFPLRTVQPTHRHHLLDLCRSRTEDKGVPQPKRLTWLRVEIDSKNDSHGGCG